MAYIYEHIRTKGFEPMHFEEHYTRLDALARKLFFAPLAIEREALQRMIAECLRGANCSQHTINAVYVRYTSNKEVEVECVDTLYDEFSLRALRPHLFVCRVSGELLTDNTSAKEALLELNRTIALASEQGVALWVNEQDEVLAIDGAAVVAVFDDEVRFSRMGSGVEFDLAYNAVCKMGRNASKQEIRLEELAEAKELLYIDHRGISAVANYGATVYMDIIAAKIADNIE
jgi:branched-subunit amino acid aminotransferase/4-amino-4-deoxychorismate lyase